MKNVWVAAMQNWRILKKDDNFHEVAFVNKDVFVVT